MNKPLLTSPSRHWNLSLSLRKKKVQNPLNWKGSPASQSFWVIPPIVDGTEVWALTGPLQNFYWSHAFVDFDVCFWATVMMKCDISHHFQLFDWGLKVLCQHMLVFGVIHFPIYPDPWPSWREAAPKYGVPWMMLCTYLLEWRPEVQPLSCQTITHFSTKFGGTELIFWCNSNRFAYSFL